LDISPADTALVIIDPQNDFLSPDGATWGPVGDSVTANNERRPKVGRFAGPAIRRGPY